MQKYFKISLILGIFLLIGLTAYINLAKQRAIDKSKLPQSVEMSKGFQKWITNLKKKGYNVSGDDFRLHDTGEVYNPDQMKVYNYNDTGMPELYAKTMLAAHDTDMVVLSPDEKIFIDYRNRVRDGYQPNEVRFYGLIEDKIVDLRVLDCSTRANCYFDRAYFVDPETLVVSEFSRNINKRDTTTPLCATNEECTYTFKVHVLSLRDNKRWVFESLPFNAIYNQVIPNL